MPAINTQSQQIHHPSSINFTPTAGFEKTLKESLQQRFKSGDADIHLKDYIRDFDRKGNTVINLNCEIFNNKKNTTKEYTVTLTLTKQKTTLSKEAIASTPKTAHAKSSLLKQTTASSPSQVDYTMKIYKKRSSGTWQSTHIGKSPKIFQQHFQTTQQKPAHTTSKLHKTSDNSLKDKETAVRKTPISYTPAASANKTTYIQKITSYSLRFLQTTLSQLTNLKRVAVHQAHQLSRNLSNTSNKVTRTVGNGFKSSISIDSDAKSKIQNVKIKLENPYEQLTNEELKIVLNNLTEFTTEQNIACLNSYVLANSKPVLNKFLAKSGFTPGDDLPLKTMQKNVDILEKHLDNIIHYGILSTANSKESTPLGEKFKKPAQDIIHNNSKACRNCKIEQQKIEKAVAPLKQITSHVIAHLQQEIIGESNGSWEQVRKEKLESIFDDLTGSFHNLIQKEIGTTKIRQNMTEDLEAIQNYHNDLQKGNALPNSTMYTHAVSGKIHSLETAIKESNSQLSAEEKTTITNVLTLLNKITTIDELELKTDGEFKRDGYSVDFKEVANVVTYTDQIKIDIKTKQNEYVLNKDVLNPKLNVSQFYANVDFKTGLTTVQDPKTGKNTETVLFQKSAPMLEKHIGSGGSAEIFLMHYATGVKVQKRPKDIDENNKEMVNLVKKEFAHEADFATRIRPEADKYGLSMRGLPEAQKMIDRGDAGFCIEGRFYNEGDLEGCVLKNIKAATTLADATKSSFQGITDYFDRKTGISQAFADMLSALKTFEQLNYSQLDQKLGNALIDKKRIGSYEGQASDFGSVVSWNSWRDGSISEFIQTLQQLPITDAYQTKPDLKTFNALKDKIKTSFENYGSIYERQVQKQGASICLQLMQQEIDQDKEIFKDSSIDPEQLMNKSAEEILDLLTPFYKANIGKRMAGEIKKMARPEISAKMDKDASLKKELESLSQAAAMHIGNLTPEVIDKLSLAEAIFAFKAISEKMIVANIGLNCYQFQHPMTDGGAVMAVPNEDSSGRKGSLNDLKNDPQAIRDFIAHATDPDADKRPTLTTLLQTTGLVEFLDSETSRLQKLTVCLNACREASDAITQVGTLSIMQSHIDQAQKLIKQSTTLNEMQKSITDNTEKEFINSALNLAEKTLANFEIEQKRAAAKG